MFRTAASRSVQSFRTTTPSYSFTANLQRATLRTSARPIARPGSLSLALRQPLQKSLVRYETTYQKASFAKSRDDKAEAAYGAEKLQPIPALVSAESSIHPVTGEVGGAGQEEDIDMTKQIRSDFVS